MEKVDQNFYDILGRIPRYATLADIKKAYRTLAKLYHPDKNDDKGYAHDMMQKLNEAYEILSNPEKRADYDKKLDDFMRKKEEDERLRVQKEQEEIKRRAYHSSTKPKQSHGSSMNIQGLIGVILVIVALGLLINLIAKRSKK